MTEKQYIQKLIDIKCPYGLEKINYKGAKQKLTLVCAKHGDFEVWPSAPLQGHKCSKCAKDKITEKAKENFFSKAVKLYGHLNIYDEEKFTTGCNKVEINCKIHGPFKVYPSKHLRGQGCPDCSKSGFKYNKPAIVYYLKDLDTNLYKIGKTNRTIEERFTQKKLLRAKIIKVWKFSDGFQASKKENEILEKYSNYRILNENYNDYLGGKTEFFTKDILQLEELI